MNTTLLRSQGREQKVMVLLGFEGNDLDLNQSSNLDVYPYRLREFPSSYMAFRWLQARINNPAKLREIQAIICSHKFLVEEDFMLPRAIQDKPTLREIPFISLYEDSMPDISSAIEVGIDDAFQLPVNPDLLENRINFLKKFKKDRITVSKSPEDNLNFQLPFAKRAFDVLFALFALVALYPIFLLTALAIKLTDKGPLTYTSDRVGTGFNVFQFLKFRSMYPDADKRLEQMKKDNQYGDGVFVKFANDPRVTPVGRIIRKYSIDELPQLINVLRGDMSIVGNRPLPLYEAKALTRDQWARRFLAPAGITGLWQVSKRGKNDMSMQERIDLDVEYARNWSFWYDIKLILKTPFSIVQSADV